MNRIITAAAAIAFTAGFAGTAVAGPTCTKEPKEKWISEDAMKQKVEELGYKVKTFKISGPCYEIYGWNKDGKKAEVYFNPTNGEIVKAEIGG